jgi:hypothetical protein
VRRDVPAMAEAVQLPGEVRSQVQPTTAGRLWERGSSGRMEPRITRMTRHGESVRMADTDGEAEARRAGRKGGSEL